MHSNIPYEVSVNPLSKEDDAVEVGVPRDKGNVIKLTKPTLFDLRSTYEKLLLLVVAGGWHDDNSTLTPKQLRDLMHLDGMTFSHVDEIRKKLHQIQTASAKFKDKSGYNVQYFYHEIERAFIMPTIMANETTKPNAFKIADFWDLVQRECQYHPTDNVPFITTKKRYLKSAHGADNPLFKKIDHDNLASVPSEACVASYPYYSKQAFKLTGKDVIAHIDNLLFYLA